MAFSLSFSPEFFVGPHDLEGGVEFDAERPTSVFQALTTMSDEDWASLARDVFGCEPDFLDVDTVMAKIRETDSCRDLRSPVEVYIDSDGWHSVRVYDEVGPESDDGKYTSQHVDEEKFEEDG